MKLFAVISSTIVAIAAIPLIPTISLAQIVGYKGNDGYFHIRGLEVNKYYQVNLGGMPLIKSAVANSCGILRIAYSKGFQESDKFEIRDEKKGETYGFENKNLPIIETSRCNGQPTVKRELWKDNKGTLFISGFTPNGALTLRLLSINPVRNLRANLCGMISLRLDTNPPKAFILDGQAYSTTGQASRGIRCRLNTLYVGYPAPTPVNSVSESDWRTQNPPSFSGGITLVQRSGTDWIEIKTEGNGGPGYAGGGTGNGGGTTVQSPLPPVGSTFCKIGSSQLLVTGLTSGTSYYVATPEDDIYSEATATNNQAIFNNVDYTDTWEGQSADIELGKNPSRQFIKVLSVLSAIQSCQ
ncbi:hypothetical protein F7734_09860 [Scytonema sp. UIC 10036]|uniref:hypothetical protein n=1 Tax=Scytonema sp. UIC 10036 TaxID=2304196 RepID=UPI0012DA05C4|nr:hypothetical protein [Scytonema sp. UIC 10036]MUG92736.1 hypothetical protein [Scytonema sp. UIC 10036]